MRRGRFAGVVHFWARCRVLSLYVTGLGRVRIAVLGQLFCLYPLAVGVNDAFRMVDCPVSVLLRI